MLSENEYEDETAAPEQEVEEATPEPSEPEYEIVEDDEVEQEEPSAELNEEEAELLEEGGLEEEPDEAAVLKEKYKKLQAKLSKERRLQGQLKNQNALLQREAEEAKQRANLASEAANFHFMSDIDKRIASATQKYKAAREFGDMDAEAEALNELQQANILKAKAEDTQYQKNLQKEIEQQQLQEPEVQPQNPYELNQASFSDWAEENASWLDPNSPHHDPVLVRGVDRFLTEWNTNLIEEGYQDYIGSEHYNQILQQKVEEARSRTQTVQKRRPPQMRPVQRAAAPIRGSARTTSAPKPQLTRTEMQMLEGLRAAGYEAKVDSYFKAKDKVIAKNRAARGTWG